MNRRLLIEVVVASASWGIIALAIAIFCGFSPFLWPICGALMGGICYRFSDVCHAVRMADSKNFLPLKGVLIACSECLYVFSVITLALLPVQTLIFWYMVTSSNWDWVLGYPLAILWTMCGMGFVVVAFEAALNRENNSRSWTFPLIRRLAFLCPKRLICFAQSFYNNAGWTIECECEEERLTSLSIKGLGSVFRNTISGVVFFNTFVILMLPLGLLLLMDVLATAMLACASNERIAVSFGAAVGCCVAMLLSFAGVTYSITLLSACGVSGGAFGGIVYVSRAWLTAHPPTFKLPDFDASTAS